MLRTTWSARRGFRWQWWWRSAKGGLKKLSNWLDRLQCRPPGKGVRKVLISFSAHQVSLSSVSTSPCSPLFRMNKLLLIQMEKRRTSKKIETKEDSFYVDCTIFFFEIPKFFFLSTTLSSDTHVHENLSGWFLTEENQSYITLKGLMEVRFVQVCRKRWIQKNGTEGIRVREPQENWKMRMEGQKD